MERSKSTGRRSGLTARGEMIVLAWALTVRDDPSIRDICTDHVTPEMWTAIRVALDACVATKKRCRDKAALSAAAGVMLKQDAWMNGTPWPQRVQ